MGLRRDIETILARPADSLALREVIHFWAEHKSGKFSSKQVATAVHRSVPHVEGLLVELAEFGVLSREQEGLNCRFSWILTGSDAFEVVRFAHSKGFHEQKLVRSTDRFRSLYQRKPSE